MFAKAFGALTRAIKRRPGGRDVPFPQALTATAGTILGEGSETSRFSHVVRVEVEVAAFIVINEVVAYASRKNLTSLVGVLDFETRELADLTFFCLLLPAIMGELEAAGVAADSARVALYHLTGVTGAALGREAAIQAISLAGRRAPSLTAVKDQDASLKLFVETSWRAILAFAWSGNKQLLLGYFESAYELFRPPVLERVLRAIAQRPA